MTQLFRFWPVLISYGNFPISNSVILADNMLAVRTASTHVRNRGLKTGTTPVFCVKLEIARYYLENNHPRVIEPHGNQSDELVYIARSYNTYSSSSKSYVEVSSFSSEAKVKCNARQSADLENLAAPGNNIGDQIILESECLEGGNVTDNVENELVQLHTQKCDKDKQFLQSRATSMAKVIHDTRSILISRALDRWVEEGNEVTQTTISLTRTYLRRRQMFIKALELYKWLESRKHVEFLEGDYASHVDLIAKVHGVSKAERYIQNIPESFRGERVYRTLLANCANFKNVKKAEEVFNNMKDKFPLTCFSCNQLLSLYKHRDKKKIAEVLLLMEKENIKPSVTTYQILITLEGLSHDCSRMEHLVEKMKSEGLEPNTQIKITLARRYAAHGVTDKAEAILKDMEGDDLMKNRWFSQFVLPIYATLGREDEVERIWKVCELNPQMEECMAAIEAWGKLGRIEDAEAAFEKMKQKLKRPPAAKHYAALLKVYVNHKILDKGKDIMSQMQSDCTLGPDIWDTLVKLHIEAGEVEQADSVLQKAINQKKGSPLFISYFAVLEQYAKNGDINNAEKIFRGIKEAGYTFLYNAYRVLLQAYINAKVPACGFNERLKADNVIPNGTLAGLLVQAGAFRDSAAADELQECGR